MLGFYRAVRVVALVAGLLFAAVMVGQMANAVQVYYAPQPATMAEVRELLIPIAVRGLLMVAVCAAIFTIATRQIRKMVYPRQPW